MTKSSYCLDHTSRRAAGHRRVATDDSGRPVSHTGAVPKNGNRTVPRIAHAFAAAIVALAVAFAPGVARCAAEAIRVASKIDTEGALLGNVIAAVLEAHGLPVERKIQLGPTNIVRAAILAGQIDIYPEYTGNGALFFHRESDPVWKEAASGYAEIKKLDAAENKLVWLAPAPANNTWVIAIRHD